MSFEKKSPYHLNEPATDLPPGIGPHELRELELMLKGEKPLAMFSDAVPGTIELPEADFEPYVKSGRIVKRVEFLDSTISDHTFRFLYYALPGEEWRISELHRLITAGHLENYRFNGDDERRIGRLLGYSDAQIETFLRHANKVKKSLVPISI